MILAVVIAAVGLAVGWCIGKYASKNLEEV